MFIKISILVILLLIMVGIVAFGAINAFLPWFVLRNEQPVTAVATPGQPQPASHISAPAAIPYSTIQAEDTKASWLTYVTTDGFFSIQFPTDYRLYENQIPTVDGVIWKIR